MIEREWYLIDNIGEVDTPALSVYRDRVKDNIRTLIQSIDDIARLRPHVKTHKSAEVSLMMLQEGIRKFKCATISEAEMLGSIGAPDVLLAYQAVGPKAKRLASLIQQYPQTHFSSLIDNFSSAGEIAGIFERINLSHSVFIDLNIGMNRTGVVPDEAFDLFNRCVALTGITITGLHAYDGHIRDMDFEERKKKCDAAFAPVLNLQSAIRENSGTEMTIVAGGTPTFTIHCLRPAVDCSPGTFVYWDDGYQAILKEQHFSPAALVLSRVISRPTPDTICIDLGHKAIASENPLERRVHFLNAPNLVPIGQSEEHMVLRVDDEKKYEVGHVLYGIPYHICPTVALYDRAAVVERNTVGAYWNTLARNRKITI